MKILRADRWLWVAQDGPGQWKPRRRLVHSQDCCMINRIITKESRQCHHTCASRHSDIVDCTARFPLRSLWQYSTSTFPHTGHLAASPCCVVCLPVCFIHPLKQWRTQEFFFAGEGSTNSVEDRGQKGRGSGGGSPLVRGSGGSCNLVQEISFHMVKFS